MVKSLEGLFIVTLDPWMWEEAREGEPGIREIKVPAGAVLRLLESKPGGYLARRHDTGDDLYILTPYLHDASVIQEGEESIIRRRSGKTCICSSCGYRLGRWSSRWIHVNRAMEGELLCPDCAAVLLAESSGLNFEDDDREDA
jgi:hypothetical protein